jgi:hypothetical protein
MLPDHDSGLNPEIGRRLDGIAQAETQFTMRIAIDEPKAMHSLGKDLVTTREPTARGAMRLAMSAARSGSAQSVCA